MVTCRCKVSYNSSFSRRSSLASFSRLDLPPLLLDGRHIFSVFSFLIVSGVSTLVLFRRRGSLGDDRTTSLFSEIRRFPDDLRRFVSRSPSSESSSELNSSYAFSVTVRFRPLRLVLSSTLDGFRCFGGCGSNIS